MKLVCPVLLMIVGHMGDVGVNISYIARYPLEEAYRKW